MSFASAHEDRPEDRLIGERTCANCGRKLFDHCELHLVPCCPGKCPGPSALQRLLRHEASRPFAGRVLR